MKPESQAPPLKSVPWNHAGHMLPCLPEPEAQTSRPPCLGGGSPSPGRLALSSGLNSFISQTGVTRVSHNWPENKLQT